MALATVSGDFPAIFNTFSNAEFGRGVGECTNVAHEGELS